MIGILTVGLLSWLAACSDDDKPVPDTWSPIEDTGPEPDTVSPDAGPGLEAGTDAEPMEAGSDAGPQYSALVGAVEYVGKKSPDGGAIRMVQTLAAVDYVNHPTIKPDFIDKPTPPNCTAYRWAASGQKNASAWDAGKLTITGHQTGATVVYLDGDDVGTGCTPACAATEYCNKDGTCGNLTPLPASIECDRKQIGTTGLYTYDCGLPSTTVLPAGSMFDANTKMDVSAAGGADVGAFSETGIDPGEAPNVTTNLFTLDPKNGIKIEWDTSVSAHLAVIAIKARLADNSEFTDITCSAAAMIGSQDIPQGALDKLPTPTATNPLIMQVAVSGVKLKGTNQTWGAYKVGAGKGVFGVSIVTP
jgi:hypothetical protein